MASASGVSQGQAATYSGQFVTLNFILPTRWRRAALCLKVIKVIDRLLRLPTAYTTTAKRSVHQRGFRGESVLKTSYRSSMTSGGSARIGSGGVSGFGTS